MQRMYKVALLLLEVNTVTYLKQYTMCNYNYCMQKILVIMVDREYCQKLFSILKNMYVPRKFIDLLVALGLLFSALYST